MSRLERACLIWLWGYRAGDVEAFGFARGRPYSDASRFLGGDWCTRYVHTLNDGPAKVLTENKWVFSQFADGLGLPVPTTLGFFDAVHGTTWDGARPLRTVQEVLAELWSRQPDGLVLKPAGGGQGKHVIILDAIDHDTGAAVTRTGERTTLEETLAGLDLTGERGVTGYVLQAPLRNHPQLARLAPSTTNTVRVLTIVRADGTPEVQATAMRLGRVGGMVDNVSSGGIGIPVDTATGTIGRGLVTGSPERVTVHPDTGTQFTGQQVPCWDATLDLCLRAARLFPGLRSLGWDVVITADGPVLLEANAEWSLRGLQEHSDGWLADPVIRAQFEDSGIPLPTGKITRYTARRLADRISSRLGR